MRLVFPKRIRLHRHSDSDKLNTTQRGETPVRTGSRSLRTSLRGAQTLDLFSPTNRQKRPKTHIPVGPTTEKQVRKRIDNLCMSRPQIELRTLLLKAALAADIPEMRVLLEEGAGVDKQFINSGFTALHQAIGTSNYEMTELLIEYGANLEHDENANAQTPIMSAIIMDDLPMLKLLVKHGAQLDAVDQDNQTYADYAREIGRDTIAEYIDTMLTGN